MALTWNLSGIKNWETVCRTEDQTMNAVTHTIILLTMPCGMPSITEKNWQDFFVRVDILQRRDKGAFLYEDKDGKTVPYYLTPKDIQDHIGLTTNASKETDAKWERRVSKYLMGEAVREARARVA